MKMLWFFTATSTIPWPFKLCGMFQAACDSYLGVQYWMYGSGPASGVPSHLGHAHAVHANGNGHALKSEGLSVGAGMTRSRTPSNAMFVPMTMSEKEERLD